MIHKITVIVNKLKERKKILIEGLYTDLLESDHDIIRYFIEKNIGLDRDFIERLHQGMIKTGRFEAASYLDENVRLDSTILANRMKCNFNLVDHLRSIKETTVGQKPSCECLYCKTKYIAELNKKGYVDVCRSIHFVKKQASAEEAILANPYLSDKYKERIRNKYRNNIPVLSKTSPVHFANLQQRVARRLKNKVAKFSKLARQLHYILAIPDNI